MSQIFRGTVSAASKLRSGLAIIVGGHVVAASLATVAGEESWWSQVLMPAVRLLSPEAAHNLAVKAAKYGILPVDVKKIQYESLKTEVWDKQFSNPIGLAAGFDKQGEAVDGVFKMGFGFMEVGSVTPLPQKGNPKPRMFRLLKDDGVINRFGFNSDGHEVVCERLKSRKQGKEAPGVVGINLGKNKDSENAIEDYVKGVQKFGELADYIVINVSSPNTPGLRAMQGRKNLQELVDKVLAERDKLSRAEKLPVLVKIAPDLSEQDKIDIAAVVAKRKGGVDGLIVCNTTIQRPSSLISYTQRETGGLSGEPLRDMATKMVQDMYKLTQGRIPIIGVGGVRCGRDAYEKIRAGASLVQLYTGMAYEGPPLVKKIKRELAELLEKDNFKSVSEAVGADIKQR